MSFCSVAYSCSGETLHTETNQQKLWNSAITKTEQSAIPFSARVTLSELEKENYGILKADVASMSQLHLFQNITTWHHPEMITYVLYQQ